MTASELLFSKENNDIVNLCKLEPYKKAFLAGLVAPDITILYYYTSGSTYSSTHNWGFHRNLALQVRSDHPEEKCFVYGVASHYAGDYLSHNFLIPQAIEKYGVPNYIIHVLQEGATEAHIIHDYPDFYLETRKSLLVLKRTIKDENGNTIPNPDFNPYLLQMVKNALPDPAPIDVEAEINRLDYFLGSFYDNAYVLPVAYKNIAGFLRATTTVDYQKWLEKTMEVQNDIYVKGIDYARVHYPSPHGLETLQAADSRIAMSWIRPPTWQDVTQDLVWTGLRMFVLISIVVGIVLLVIFIISFI